MRRKINGSVYGVKFEKIDDVFIEKGCLVIHTRNEIGRCIDYVFEQTEKEKIKNVLYA